MSVYVLAQFAVLLVAHSHFLALLARQSNAWNVLYFLFLLLTLIVLGGLLENRRIFAMLEALRLALVAAVVAGAGGWFNLRTPADRAAIALFAAISLCCLTLIFRRNALGVVHDHNLDGNLGGLELKS